MAKAKIIRNGNSLAVPLRKGIAGEVYKWFKGTPVEVYYNLDDKSVTVREAVP